MKKFYLHLRGEVFFGLSCKNLPFAEGQGIGEVEWGQPLYNAASGDNKSNSFLLVHLTRAAVLLALIVILKGFLITLKFANLL